MNSLSLDFNSISTHIAEVKKNIHILNSDFKPYQPQLDFLNNTAQKSILFGPNRSGKTFTGCVYGKMHLTGRYPSWYTGHRFEKPIRMLAVGRTFSQMSEVLIPAYFGSPTRAGVFHDSEKLNYVRTPYPKALVQHESGGVSELVFVSSETDFANLGGFNAHVIHVDEECSSKVMPELFTRNIATDGVNEPGKKRFMYFTLCPTLGLTELVESVLSKTKENEVSNNNYYRTISMDDVTHMSAEEKQRMFDELPEHEREARYYGRPNIAVGLVYPVCHSSITVEPFEIPDDWYKIVGLDFGWHNTAAVVITQDPKTKTYYIIDEYKLGQLTPSEHAANFIKRGWHKYSFYYDPSGNRAERDGETLASLYRQAGLKMIQANNSTALINDVLKMYRSQELKIFNTNIMLLKEMRQYKRDNDSKIVKEEDHLCDAKRYAIATGLNEFNMSADYRSKSNKSFYYGS